MPLGWRPSGTFGNGEGFFPYDCQGCENPAFGKPWFCLRDTHRFRRSEDEDPCFLCVECKLVILAVFVKIPCFRQGAKPPFPKTTVFTTLKLAQCLQQYWAKGVHTIQVQVYEHINMGKTSTCGQIVVKRLNFSQFYCGNWPRKAPTKKGGGFVFTYKVSSSSSAAFPL